MKNITADQAIDHVEWFFSCADELVGFASSDPSVEFVSIAGNSVEKAMVELIDARGESLERSRNVARVIATCSSWSQSILETTFTVPQSKFEQLTLILIEARKTKVNEKGFKLSATRAKEIWKQLTYRKKANLYDIVGTKNMMNEGTLTKAVTEARTKFDQAVNEFVQKWNSSA